MEFYGEEGFKQPLANHGKRLLGDAGRSTCGFWYPSVKNIAPNFRFVIVRVFVATARRICRVIAANAVLIRIDFQNIFRPARIMLQRRQTFQKSRATPMHKQFRRDVHILTPSLENSF